MTGTSDDPSIGKSVLQRNDTRLRLIFRGQAYVLLEQRMGALVGERQDTFISAGFLMRSSLEACDV